MTNIDRRKIAEKAKALANEQVGYKTKPTEEQERILDECIEIECIHAGFTFSEYCAADGKDINSTLLCVIFFMFYAFTASAQYINQNQILKPITRSTPIGPLCSGIVMGGVGYYVLTAHPIGIDSYHLNSNSSDYYIGVGCCVVGVILVTEAIIGKPKHPHILSFEGNKLVYRIKH